MLLEKIEILMSLIKTELEKSITDLIINLEFEKIERHKDHYRFVKQRYKIQTLANVFYLNLDITKDDCLVHFELVDFNFDTKTNKNLRDFIDEVDTNFKNFETYRISVKFDYKFIETIFLSLYNIIFVFIEKTGKETIKLKNELEN